MPFRIVRDDIVNLKVDAVVNAANTELRMGGGVCGAIFRAAGAEALREACAPLAPIPCGGAAITPGFRLNARFIIHTAGPVYRGGQSGESRLLRSCYVNALRLARQNGCASVAFPLISSGIYGYPREEALAIATSAIADFLLHEDDGMTVLLVVFDKASFVFSTKLLGDVAAYIDEHYDEHYVEQHFEPASDRPLQAAPQPSGYPFHCADEEGTRLNYRAMSEAVLSFRRCGKVSEHWGDAIQEDFRRRGGLPR